jgi:hypothetical protein
LDKNTLSLYNNNTYIRNVRFLFEQLKEVEGFLLNVAQKADYSNIEELTIIFKNIFEAEDIKDFIEFRIEKIFKSLYLKNPGEYTRGNSYYFLALKIKNQNLLILDDLYSNVLSTLIKLYKHSFSKIDDYFITLSKEQLDKFNVAFNEIKNEVDKFLSAIDHRNIIGQRKKLNEIYLKKLPHGGLYYMVDSSHIQSILEKGIYSHNLAHNQGLVKEDISNKEVNSLRNRIEPVLNKNIHDYAPLYINPKNPMLYVLCKNGHKENTLLLRVNPHILMLDNI